MNSRTLTDLINELRLEFEKAQDSKKALSMAAYLQNRFACYGIKTPVRHEIEKPWLAKVKSVRLDHWDVTYELWNLDQREYQYVAVDLLKKTSARYMRKDDYRNLEELITTKSWWDSVDLIASNYVGVYFRTFPEMRDSVIARWRKSPNIWLNRTCLIFQLKYGEKTDFELLKSLIREYQGNPEFFIAKAIGWSLRQYSKFNPKAVQEFIRETDLKGLALREASRYLPE